MLDLYPSADFDDESKDWSWLEYAPSSTVTLVSPVGASNSLNVAMEVIEPSGLYEIVPVDTPLELLHISGAATL